MQRFSAVRDATAFVGGAVQALFSLALYIFLSGFSFLFVLHEFGLHPFQPMWLNFLIALFVGPMTMALSVPLLIIEVIGWIIGHV